MVLPGLPVGPCLKLLNRLGSSITPMSPPPPPPQVPVRSRSPSPDSDRENQPPSTTSVSISQPGNSPAPQSPGTPAPRSLQNLPYSGEFPIDRLIFGPSSQQAFRTGIVRRDAKSEILQVLHLKIMQLSFDKSYSDRRIRYDAAEALIAKYPQLREGRSVRDAVLSWRNSLTAKAKSVRRRLDTDSDPRLAEERTKYRTTRSNQLQPSPRRRRPTLPDINEDESEDQGMQQQQMKAEFLKPMRDRNQRYITELFKQTFPLRRNDILTKSNHMCEVLREWPALKNYNMIIQDLLAIEGVAENVLTDIPSDAILKYAEEFSGRLPRGHPMLRVLYPQDRQEDDAVITDAIAVALLPYFLPTRAKKTLLETHRFLIDMYPVDTPVDEVVRDVHGRDEPWILIRGSWRAVEKIQVVADGICIASVPSVTAATHVVIALHYLQDTEYNKQVKLSLKFIEQCVCGLKKVGKEDYREITTFDNILKKQD